MKIAFSASPTPTAQESLKILESRYQHVGPAEADVIVVLGGDGQVLKTLHAFLGTNKKVYALRRTQSVGFLCNDYCPQDLLERIEKAHTVALHPLKAVCSLQNGGKEEALAINEVTFLRDSPQSAKLQIAVDGVERIHRYSGDGLLLATPAGSTAYNHSAGGPIMPLDSNTLVMTAVCGFRPRRWSYAILPQDSIVDIKVVEIEKRPVRVEAGLHNIHGVVGARISMDSQTTFSLLFDPEQHLGERIVREQFML